MCVCILPQVNNAMHSLFQTLIRICSRNSQTTVLGQPALPHYILRQNILTVGDVIAQPINCFRHLARMSCL
jgi:hypothetical protein